MSSNIVKIAGGALLAILLLVLVFRSGDDTESTATAPAKVDIHADDAVRQRLDRLRASREQGSESEAPAGNSRIDPRPGAASAPALPARGAQPAAPAAGAEMQRLPGQIPPARPGNNLTGTAGLLRDSMEDIATLKNMAINDKDPDRRLEAVILLGATEAPEVVSVLGQSLSDENAEVRLAAIQALADFTDDGIIEMLGKAVTNDPEAENRYEALDALADLEDERATAYAKHALDDPDEEVRELAESMLNIDNQAAPSQR